MTTLKIIITILLLFPLLIPVVIALSTFDRGDKEDWMLTTYFIACFGSVIYIIVRFMWFSG